MPSVERGALDGPAAVLANSAPNSQLLPVFRREVRATQRPSRRPPSVSVVACT